MGDGKGDSAPLDPIILQKTKPDLSCIVVAFEDGDLRDALRRIKDKVAFLVPLDIDDCFLSGDSVLDDLNGSDAVALQVHLQLINRKGLDMHGTPDREDRSLLEGRQVGSVLGNLLSLDEDSLGLEFLQVVEQNDVRPFTGSQAAPVFQMIAFGRVQRRHADCHDRVDPGFYEHPQMVVDVPIFKNGFGLAVV